MSHHGYGLAFDAMSKAAAECGVEMHKMAAALYEVKFTRTIKLHPSFNPIEVPIWAPIFRKKVRV